MKLDYALDPTRRDSRYRVETYLFVPTSLGLDRHTYRRKQFYADVQAYIRFKSPRVALASLVDHSNRHSPLMRVRRLITSTEGEGHRLEDSELAREMRMFSCTVRANLRDRSSEIRELIEAQANADQTEAHHLFETAQGLIADLLAEAAQVTESFRELKTEFRRPEHPRWSAELYAYVDEYLSISVETYLTSILARIDECQPSSRALPEVRRQLSVVLVAEQQHRRDAGYLSVLRHDGDNHSFLYRKSALKKFMSSVLFLELRRQEEGRGLANITAGVASAVAMVFSTAIAIWSQGRYGLNSLPFVAAVVVAYVFKDRIKEWLRAYFSGHVARYLYDHSMLILDPAVGGPVGRCRESFTYLSEHKVPPEVIEFRHGDSDSILERGCKPEVVMKYVKDVRLRTQRILRAHGRLADVNDIVRLNLSGFLNRMAHPIQEVATYSEELGRVMRVSCPKSYHVNVVMVLMAEGQEASVSRFRIIMGKRGIREIQEVELSNTPKNLEPSPIRKPVANRKGSLSRATVG